MKVYFKALGCAKNRAEAETLAGRLAARGAMFVGDPAAADAAVVHTCAFIAPAAAESRAAVAEVVRAAARRPRRGGRPPKIIVSGCLAQASALGGRLAASATIPAAADFLVGTGRLGELEEIVFGEHPRRPAPAKGSPAAAPPTAAVRSFIGAPGGFHDAASRPADSAGRPWAYLRVAEGCDHRCNYCLIPSLRGGYKSRPPEDILREAASLAASGVRELNLISQDTSGWGRDLKPSRKLPLLLAELEKIPGVDWLRLLYCHPSTVRDELLECIASSEKIVRYLDMPLQHISDNVLAAMGRPGDGASLRRLVSRIKSVVPGLALRTTFIVGHPGETARDFAELEDFVGEGHFMWTGVFEYSPVKNPAPDGKRPSRAAVRRRVRALQNAARSANRKALESFAGKKVRALVVAPTIVRPYFCAPESDGGEIVLNQSLNIGDFTEAVCGRPRAVRAARI